MFQLNGCSKAELRAEGWELSSSELKASDSSCDPWSTKLHHSCCTVLHENAHLERRGGMQVAVLSGWKRDTLFIATLSTLENEFCSLG